MACLVDRASILKGDEGDSGESIGIVRLSRKPEQKGPSSPS